MNPWVKVCLALYRRLASAYPHEFRMLYGEDLALLGEDAVPEVWRRYGLPGLVRMLADIAVRLPAAYFAEVRQDVVYGLRVLAKAPGFTSIALLSLAVGIGMCCAVLSECRAIVGPAPGLHEPATLVTFIWTQVSYPYFERYRGARQTVASATAVMGPVPFAVAYTGESGGRRDRVSGHLVSPEYFTTLGVTPAAGRFFGTDSEKPGMSPVVVVSDRFWRTHLGADPHAVGRSLRLNGSVATIVGIGPKNFLGIWPQSPADLFVPITCGTSLAPELSGDPLHSSDREIFRVVFRLAPGMTLRAAESELGAMTRRLDQETGAHYAREPIGRVMRLMPAGMVGYATPEQHALVDTFNEVLWVLVLSLVCANLAGLLLARRAVRDGMSALHPDLTLFDMHTMQQDLDRMNSFAQWTSAMYVILGLFAMLLACIGLGGVTANGVARRRRELGIRVALGARAGQVQRLVLQEGTALVAVGSALGIGGAYALRRLFAAYSDMLARTFGPQDNHPLSLLGVPLALASLAMLACYLPARRATRIDPMAALREE